MNDWRGLIAQIAACGLSTPPSFRAIYRKSRVHPAITARTSQSENEWVLHWNVEKSVVTIVCGRRAIVVFSRHISGLFFGSLSGFPLRMAVPAAQLALKISSNPLAIYSCSVILHVIPC